MKGYLFLLFLFISFSDFAQCPVGTFQGQELVLNGDFSNGNAGFTSSYTYFSGGPLILEGEYSVNTNANSVHSQYQGVDHTSGTGNFMIINGAGVANTPVWCQSISVIPNTIYNFSVWVCSVFPSNPATLQFSINGIALGSTFNAPSVSGQWLQYSVTWNSGSGTSADICIVNQNTLVFGNDFGLDDISFTTCACGVSAYAGANDTICQGTSVQLNALPSGYSYQWSTGAANQNVSVNTPGNYWVSVSNGVCSDTAFITIFNYPQPTPIITGDSSVCSGLSTVLNAGSTFASYQWSTGDIGPTISVSAAGNYSVTVTSADGCTATASTNVIVIANPIPVITGDSSVCFGVNAVLDAGPGYVAYVWSTGSTAQTTLINDSGTYTVSVTSVDGCTGSTQRIIARRPVIYPVITGDTILCSGEQTVLSAGNGFQQYLWLTGDTTPSITVSAPGNYSVATNGITCPANDAITVLRSAISPPAIIGDTLLCAGDTGTLGLTAVFANYMWSSGSITNFIFIDQPGWYSVMTTDTNGCVSSDSAEVFLIPPSSLNVSAIKDCNTTLVHFNTGGENISVTEWNFGDNVQGTGNQISHAYIDTGTFTISLQATTFQGCRIDSSFGFTIDTNQLRATITGPQGMQLLSESLHFNATLTAGRADEFTWTFADGAVENGMEVYHHYNYPGDYIVELVVTDTTGCADTIQYFVQVLPIYIPNAFTPNQDGVNEIFNIFPDAFIFQEYSLSVFDRWGDKIFESRDPMVGWDGRYLNQSPAPEDAYNYELIIRKEGVLVMRKNGKVMLIR